MANDEATLGHLRLALPQLKSRPGEADAAEAALRRIKGIRSVKASAFTGTVLIRYKVRPDERRTLLDEIQRATNAHRAVAALPSMREAPARQLLSSGPDRAGNRLSEILLRKVVEKCVEVATLALVAALL